MEDLGKLKYFMGIELPQSKSRIKSQRKYVVDILKETIKLNFKTVDTPMDSNIKVLPNQREPLLDFESYIQLVGKLNCCTMLSV